MNDLPKNILDKMEEKANVWNDDIKPHILKGILIGYQMKAKEQANPSSPTTEQTELSDYDDQSKMWVDVIAVVISITQLNNGLPSEALDMLKEKYTLTRKEEVPEAVEFAEWLIKNSDDRTDNDRYAADGSVKSIPELYQEFQLFKQQKP